MLIDLHTHTGPQSDDSKLSPDVLLRKAREAGLDAVCLTEHDRFWNETQISRLCEKHGLLVMRGVELNTEIGHLLVFGLDRYSFGMHRVDYVRQLVSEVGGFMILAHPYRRRFRVFEGHSVESAVDRACQDQSLQLVDALEVLNGLAQPEENAFSQQLSVHLGLKGCGGSDAHSTAEIPSCATRFQKRIRDVEDLIPELRAGRFEAVDLRRGTPGTASAHSGTPHMAEQPAESGRHLPDQPGAEQGGPWKGFHGIA